MWNVGVDIGTSGVAIARSSGNPNGTVSVEPNSLVLPNARDTGHDASRVGLNQALKHV